MIPFIRSLSELMAITERRESRKNLTQKRESDTSTLDSGQRKRYARSLEKDEVDIPGIPKKTRNNWIQKKDISSLIAELDCNDQIQSSYDLTLLERQNKRNRQDVA